MARLSFTLRRETPFIFCLGEIGVNERRLKLSEFYPEWRVVTIHTYHATRDVSLAYDFIFDFLKLKEEMLFPKGIVLASDGEIWDVLLPAEKAEELKREAEKFDALHVYVWSYVEALEADREAERDPEEERVIRFETPVCKVLGYKIP